MRKESRKSKVCIVLGSVMMAIDRNDFQEIHSVLVAMSSCIYLGLLGDPPQMLGMLLHRLRGRRCGTHGYSCRGLHYA